jgi:hypothetical protein
MPHVRWVYSIDIEGIPFCMTFRVVGVMSVGYSCVDTKSTGTLFSEQNCRNSVILNAHIVCDRSESCASNLIGPHHTYQALWQVAGPPTGINLSTALTALAVVCKELHVASEHDCHAACQQRQAYLIQLEIIALSSGPEATVGLVPNLSAQ